MSKNIILLVLFFLVSACKGGIDETLDRVDSLVRIDCVQARHVLDSLRVAEDFLFADARHQARFILLDEYVKYREGIDETNDSLISISEEYFMQHGSDYERMLCLFVHGRILFSSNDYGSAMRKYAYAVEYASACQDHFMLGQIFTNQYLICSEAYGITSIEYAQKALDEYLLFGDSIYVMDSEVNLGRAYFRDQQLKRGELQLQSALEKATIQKDTFAMKKCVRFLAYIHSEMGEAVIADSLFRVLFDTLHEDYYLRDYAVMSEVCSQQRNFDRALLYLKYAKNILSLSDRAENRMVYLKSATSVYSAMSDSSAALRRSQEYQTLQDSVMKGYLRNSVMKEQSEFIQDKLSNREHVISQLLHIMFFLVLLVLAVFTLFSFSKQKAKREQEQRRHVEQELALKNSNIENSIRGMKLSAVVSRFQECVAKNHKPSMDEWKELNQLFLDMLPHFERELEKTCKLRDEEWEMCMLQKLDFRVMDIEKLIGIDVSVASNRLAKKYVSQSAGAKEWKQFLKNV